jgi:hypothetical protein
MSKWLTWEPSQRENVEEKLGGMAPAKPPKPSFEGFEGALPGHFHIHEGDPAPASLPETPVRLYYQVSKKMPARQTGECPYSLPEGVHLVRYVTKNPPVAVTVCSVVTDIPRFIRFALAELDARLHHPVQIKAGDSVFGLLSRLADCGLELRLEWPLSGEIAEPPPGPSSTESQQEPPESEGKRS